MANTNQSDNTCTACFVERDTGTKKDKDYHSFFCPVRTIPRDQRQ